MKAWIENGKIRDISEDPEACFHSDIASFYDTTVPTNVKPGWSLVGDTWTAPAVVAPTPVIPEKVYPVVSPVQFKLLMTVQERVAIKAARPTDAILDDLFEILEDPRLNEVDFNLKSTRDSIAYLVEKELITENRAVQIIDGVFI